jgi:methylglutaconyl-CoA hydratase
VGLVAACDIANAERGATFRLSEVKLGIIPAMISPYVVAAMGRRHAHRFMLSGEELDSAEAFRIGLVHDICEEPDLNAVVGRMLSHLYSSGPNALVAIKKLIPEVGGRRIDEALIEMTAQRIAEVRTTAEAQEGLSAFLEKRKASWVTPASERPKATSRQDARKSRSKN